MKQKHAVLDGSPVQASPYKSAVEGLDGLRKTFRSVCQQYEKRLDAEIADLRDTVAAAGADGPALKSRKARGGRDAAERIYDLRDMLTLLRTTEIDAQSPRRKDLKKIEGLIKDVRQLMERWE